MAKSFQTIFTNLTDRFSGSATRAGQPASTADNQPRNREVISASSREELDAKKLQVQQNRYLKGQFLRMVGADGDKKLMYESNRMSQYIDYQRMEYYPIISAALDLLAEESTTVGQDGKMLKVYSSNKRVKAELENLFTNTLDLNTILQFWARNLVKYGDNFVFMLLDEKRGVIGAKQLTNVEVERVEEIVEDKLVVKFKYKSAGLDEEYPTWQVAHFRLLGDDRRMPYGMSVLDKVRRTFKMLTLFEDSMMVYRITRAAERRIFKVDVGDMPEEDVDQFVEQVARSTKSTKLVDDMTGDFNWKYNVATNDSDYFIPVRNGNASSPIETLPGACLSLDTLIPLLDGRTLELGEIISEYESGNKLWVYSINPLNGEIVPGPITWAGVTRTDTQVLKLTLDNGEEIIVTPDHKFPTCAGVIKKAEELSVGETLYSFKHTNRKIDELDDEYHMVFDHAKQAYVCTHQMVAQYLTKNDSVFDESTKETIHHTDYNRRNNSPENLTYVYSENHMGLQVHAVSEDFPVYNNTIVSIEYLSDTQDTGTITVDGNEELHDFHNFALAAGVFTQNSNLSDIGDISYLRDNLFTGLGIPKAFLGFSDGSGGEGKSLSMLDIRFARKVNKIQQSLISELNKIAMVHLYILGGDYREHLDDFTLTLANPSTQSEILKIETLKAKFDTFEQATRISDNGTKAWSEIRAKREILGMSDEEIMDDLQEQMIEAKIGDEIKASGQLIRSSGLFDKLIKYKNAGFLSQPTTPGADDGMDAGGADGGGDPLGGGGGGADPLAGMDSGAQGGAEPMGGANPLPAGPLNERVRKDKKLAHGLNVILKESQLSNDLNGLVNGKESRLINENINIENSLNQLIDDLEGN